MGYRPSNVPADPALMPGFLRQELQQLALAIEAPAFVLSLAVSHQAPNRLRDGDVVLADGTDWNPGAGAGFYGYRSGAWRKLD